MQADSGDRTVVANPKWLTPAFLFGLPLIGAAAGWGLNLLADWIVSLPVFPFQGPIELFTELSDIVRLTVALSLGAVAGLILALTALHDQLTVTVDRRRLEIERGDYQRGVDASEVASVFVADKRLVVLGHRRRELARVEFDLDRDKLAAALREHGYRWRPEGDPYKDEYRRWVPDAEDLPVGANPLFKARQEALEKSKGDDLEELRAELAKLDIVVRDKDKKQYWRRSDPA
ncbi:YqeB family protein [Glycomyces tarimensis]